MYLFGTVGPEEALAMDDRHLVERFTHLPNRG